MADDDIDRKRRTARRGALKGALSTSVSTAVTTAVNSSVGRALTATGFGAALLSLDIPLANAATVLAVRVWPAHDYTRVTLELDAPLAYSFQMVADPHRLVVDLEGGDVDSAVRDLVAKIRPDDPYIQQVRVGQYKPKVMRLVFDLKTVVAPQIFALKPIDQYRHRLVLDLFPAAPSDPLQAVLADAYQRGKAAPPAAAAARTTEDPLAALLAGKAAVSASMPPSSTSGAGGNATNGPVSGLPSLAANSGGEINSGNATAGGSATSPIGTSTTSTTSASRSRNVRPVVSRLVTIAVDPGHGGEDPGAIGQHGTREKDVVLAVAHQLRDRINEEPNMRAFLTRESDFFVPLSVRVEKARRVQADLFISIHADGFVRPDARGASVFVLSGRGASSTAARWLANKENRSDLIGGVRLTGSNTEVARMLLEMSTATQIRDSSNLGRIVLNELGGLGQLHKHDIEQAGFAVLKAPDIPSILVETAFISNPQEEAKLATPHHQASIADAIFKGVRRYFIKHPPPQRSRST